MFCTVYQLYRLGTRLNAEAEARTARIGYLTWGRSKDDPVGNERAVLCAKPRTRADPLIVLEFAHPVRIITGEILLRGQVPSGYGKWVHQAWRCVPRPEPTGIPGFLEEDDDLPELMPSPSILPTGRLE